jgi:hypothetical protein
MSIWSYNELNNGIVQQLCINTNAMLVYDLNIYFDPSAIGLACIVIYHQPISSHCASIAHTSHFDFL